MEEAEVMEAEQAAEVELDVELRADERADSLEAKISSDSIEKDSSIDAGSVVVFKGKKAFEKHANYSDKNKISRANYSASKQHAKEHSAESTDNGVIALVYNEETGEVAFEQKPHDYFVASERGKLQCIGGHVKKGETSLEALIRELEEEAVSSSALVKALKEKGYNYHTQTAEFGGKIVYTEFWVVPLSNKEWKNFVDGGLMAEAGPLRTLSSRQAYNQDDKFYAFESGPIVKEIMGNIQPIHSLTSQSSHGSHSLESMTKFSPIVYSDSMNYSNLGLIKPILMPNPYFIRTSSNN